MRDIIDLSKKLIGYYGTSRGKFLLLQSNILNLQEYTLYEASIAFSDWEKGHPNTYGTFDLTQEEVEYLLRRSKGFVSRYSKKLFNVGFWKQLPNGRIRVIGFELIEIGLLAKIVKEHGVVDVQKYIAELQPSSAELQQKIAKPQQEFPKEKGINQLQKVAELQQTSAKSDSLSSNNNSFVYGRRQRDSHIQDNPRRTIEEYQKIVDEGKYKALSAEDLKWIDENIPFNSG